MTLEKNPDIQYMCIKFFKKKKWNIDNYTFNYIKMIKNDSSDIETVFNIKQLIVSILTSQLIKKPDSLFKNCEWVWQTC